MPRQSRGSAPARRSAPAPAPARPAVAPPQPPHQQARPASTAAHPPAPQQAQPPMQAPQSQGPGLFGQMASTAAGVAVGSSIGHAIGGLFSGGSSAPAEAPQQQTAVADSYSQQQNQSSGVCAQDINNFRKCMDENQGSLTICGWYLDQLKACQQAASQY
ncbi:hypothetical protein BFW01_g3520 [Lasiodiplodia theobromae]|uniref:Mitochondrial intermembrane space cysteine motif-containing protein MIX17 n=1 Tax=Lasiodiplodia theobromae TaxID=45133 RepID=A0A5N5DR99_9PEZI|nr:CHCH domain-containing protein [Lasiodiplodia theobromae]KAB2580476.1 Mitochondrial intermembrane space cysteine motif-containing protein MIX17 [Lasiodiplodia theobromae]KAF4541379.1 CHCH domain-containing protein [Lasiodiplodia theobromae]KAF9632657.1 hypothetical protein BFW01_g3520 [Lasiodiplodia theobromae]